MGENPGTNPPSNVSHWKHTRSMWQNSRMVESASLVMNVILFRGRISADIIKLRLLRWDYPVLTAVPKHRNRCPHKRWKPWAQSPEDGRDGLSGSTGWEHMGPSDAQRNKGFSPELSVGAWPLSAPWLCTCGFQTERPVLLLSATQSGVTVTAYLQNPIKVGLRYLLMGWGLYPSLLYLNNIGR